MVSGKTYFGAVRENSCEQIEVYGRNNAPLVMAALRPRIGKEKKQPSDAGFRQCVEQYSGIVIVDKDVADRLRVDNAQQIGDAVDIRFTPNEQNVRVAPRLRRNVLALPESDFEPQFAETAVPRTELREFHFTGYGDRHTQPGQQCLDENLTPGTQSAAPTAAITNMVRSIGGDLSSRRTGWHFPSGIFRRLACAG